MGEVGNDLPDYDVVASCGVRLAVFGFATRRLDRGSLMHAISSNQLHASLPGPEDGGGREGSETTQ